jgi:hypothetical protein
MSIMMKKWLQTAKPDDRGESLRSLQEVSKERITSVANQYFTNLWGVEGSQGRGASSTWGWRKDSEEGQVYDGDGSRKRGRCRDDADQGDEQGWVKY